MSEDKANIELLLGGIGALCKGISEASLFMRDSMSKENYWDEYLDEIQSAREKLTANLEKDVKPHLSKACENAGTMLAEFMKYQFGEIAKEEKKEEVKEESPQEQEEKKEEQDDVKEGKQEDLPEQEETTQAQ